MMNKEPEVVKKGKQYTLSNFMLVPNESFPDQFARQFEFLKTTTLSNGYKITPQVLQNIKKNFDNKIQKVDISLQYDHAGLRGGSTRAAAWLEEVHEEEDDTDSNKINLLTKVRWTKQGRRDVEEENYRYVSAEFYTEYQVDGIEYGPTLTGISLTNNPELSNLKPIALDQNKEYEVSDVKPKETPDQILISKQNHEIISLSKKVQELSDAMQAKDNALKISAELRP